MYLVIVEDPSFRQIFESYEDLKGFCQKQILLGRKYKVFSLTPTLALDNLIPLTNLGDQLKTDLSYEIAGISKVDDRDKLITGSFTDHKDAIQWLLANNLRNCIITHDGKEIDLHCLLSKNYANQETSS